MNAIRYAAAVSAAILLTACGRGGSPDPAGAAPQTYSATVTAIDVVRAADQQPMPLGGLPSTGAPITVN